MKNSLRLLWTGLSVLFFAMHSPDARAEDSDLLKRLEALERENAMLRRLNALERENAALKAEMHKRASEPRARREPSTTPGREPVAPSKPTPSALEANAKAVAYKAPPAPPASFNWTGLYVGGHVGWGWHEVTISDSIQVCAGTCIAGPPETILRPQGVFGGPQAGFNYQIANLVVGSEASFSWANSRKSNTRTLGLTSTTTTSWCCPPVTTTITSTSSAASTWTHETDWHGTAAVRLGLAWDRWLFYTKGGIAVAHVSYSQAGSSSLSATYSPPVSPGYSFTSTTAVTGSDIRVGIAAGVGAAWRFGENWSATIDYAYMDFGNIAAGLFGAQTNNGVPGTIAFDIPVHQRIHAATFGINYHFTPERFAGLRSSSVQ